MIYARKPYEVFPVSGSFESMSAVPGWLSALRIQQQTVVLLATRGPDGIAKDHPCKNVVRAYRATVFRAAYYGRWLRINEKADTFMSLERFGSLIPWGEDVKAFFQHVDNLPHHYTMHLMHGAQIIGYKHPDSDFRDRWNHFYQVACDDMHLPVETEETMDRRLGDWNCVYWDE